MKNLGMVMPVTPGVPDLGFFALLDVIKRQTQTA
jgi:hypothetical protein